MIAAHVPRPPCALVQVSASGILTVYAGNGTKVLLNSSSGVSVLVPFPNTVSSWHTVTVSNQGWSGEHVGRMIQLSMCYILQLAPP